MKRDGNGKKQNGANKKRMPTGNTTSEDTTKDKDS